MLNGRRDGLLHPDDRGFAYGDGLFETIAWRQGTPRFLNRHLQRLAQGCERLDIPVPDSAILTREITELAAEDACGTIRLSLSRGSGPRGYVPPLAPAPTRVVAFFPGPAAQPARALVVGRCHTPASHNPALAGLKTLNRLDNVLARAELAPRGLDEGIMCTVGGQVIGATAANLFAVRQGVMLTPDLTQGGVAGITRGVVLECAATLGIQARELCMDFNVLLEAEEIFLTNALIGLRPVALLEERAMTGRAVTRKLAHALQEQGVAEAFAC